MKTPKFTAAPKPLPRVRPPVGAPIPRVPTSRSLDLETTKAIAAATKLHNGK